MFVAAASVADRWEQIACLSIDPPGSGRLRRKQGSADQSIASAGARVTEGAIHYRLRLSRGRERGKVKTVIGSGARAGARSRSSGGIGLRPGRTGPEDAGGRYFAAGGSTALGAAIGSAFGPAEAEPQLSQHESQQSFLWQPRRLRSLLRKPSWHESQQVSQQVVGQQVGWQQAGLFSQTVTGTIRHFLTHTSSGTHTLTFLQTVQFTISVTVYGTFTVTV